MNEEVEKICLNCKWYWAKRLDGNCGRSEGTDFTCRDFVPLEDEID